MRKLPLLLLVFVIPVLALAACGEGDGEEDQIAETIETAFLSTDPADCKKLATQRFLEQTEFREDEAAMKNCVYHAERPKTANNADSIEVSNVEIDGSKATADAAFDGGTYDGQTLSLAAVEEDGNWKMEEVTGFAEFDQEKLAESFEEQFRAEGLSAEVASCAGEEFRKLPSSEFEQMVIGGSSDPFTELLGGCVQG